MEIVVEYVLVENFLINVIVLKTTQLILHEKAKFVSLLSLLSACLTLAIPLLGLSTFGIFLLELGLSMVVVSLCFSFRGSLACSIKRFFRIFCTFYLSSFLYGGVCSFLSSLFGEAVLIGILFAVPLAFFLVKRLVHFSRRRSKIEKFCYDATLSLGGSKVNVRAFLDSGNVLFDPVTKKDVALINLRTFERLCGDSALSDVLTKSEKLKNFPCSHFISIQGFSGDEKIFVFEADSLQIGKNVQEKPLFGVTFKNFKALNSDVILGSSAIEFV